MRKMTLLVVSILISTIMAAQVTQYESEGNLKSDTTGILSEVKDITSNHNPVDIYQLARAKIQQKKYDDAAVALLIALAYGKYDTLRVEDESAHQAVMVLGTRALEDLPRKRKEKMLEAVDLLMENRQRVLDILTKVGKPNYYPKYMIQHGMGAFLSNQSKDGLIPGFNPDKAWQEAIASMFPSD